jgi:hypothetical protein
MGDRRWPGLSAQDAYAAAVASESTTSAYWGKYGGLDGELLTIPNGFGYTDRILAVKRPLELALPLLRIMWAVVGMPIFATAWALRWTFTSGWGRSAAAVPPTLYMHSSADHHMLALPSGVARPEVALVLPFLRGAAPSRWSTRGLDLRGVGSRSTLWRAVGAAVAATWRLMWANRWGDLLFTYTAPQWFWVRYTLERLPVHSLWVSNHIDRWAVLAASLPGVAATIVQHGSLRHTDPSTGLEMITPTPLRLRQVERVFVIDENERALFEAHVTGPGPTFERITPGIRAVPILDKSATAVRILVIGHAIHRGEIDAILTGIGERVEREMKIAYRPHPTEVRPIRLAGNALSRAVVVDEPDLVPEVDAVLSYPSSVTERVIAATGALLIEWDPAQPHAIPLVIDSAARALRPLGS